MRRIFFVTYGCYLDSSNGASAAGRVMMETLARHDFAVEALSGLIFDYAGGGDADAWLAGLDLPLESIDGGAWMADSRGLRSDVPPHYRLTVGGVSVTLARRATVAGPSPGDEGYEDFLRLHDAILQRFQPDVLVSSGDSRLQQEIRSRARSRGTAVVFPLRHLGYRDIGLFADADAVIAPSRFASEYYKKTLGLECMVLPGLIDPGRVRVEDREPRYLTFVSPSYEKGVYAFARIADELGLRRPDIPILVIEGQGSERTLADCGLDLRRHGNVFLMGHTPNSRQFWGVTRVCLMPSLGWEAERL